MIAQKQSDPRVRLTLVLCFTTLALIFNTLDYLVPLTVFVVTCTVLSQASRVEAFMNFIKRIGWLMPFLVLVAVMQSVFNRSGQVIIYAGNVPLLTEVGLWDGIAFLCRMCIIVMSASLLASEGARRILQGVVEWKVPYELVFMTLTALQFLPVFKQEFVHSLTAIQLRGIEFDRLPISKKLTVCSYILMPAMWGMLVKAKELSLAMEMRAFRAYPQRTSYIRLKLKKGEIVAIVMIIITTLAIAIAYFMV